MFKIYNERYSDFNSLIERYEREMREAYGLSRRTVENRGSESSGTGTQSANQQASEAEALAARQQNEITNTPAAVPETAEEGTSEAVQQGGATNTPIAIPHSGGTGTPAAEPENETFERPVPPQLEPVPFPDTFPQQEQPQEEEELGQIEMPREEPQFETQQQEGNDEIGEQDGYVLQPTEEGGRNEQVSPGDGNTDRSNVQSDIGYIIVSANSGRDAIPISGVTVVIDKLDENDPSGRQELIAVLQTDRSGRTVPVKVKTVSRTLSQSPGDMGPFVTYYVSVRHPGYASVINRPVDVFGGETSLLELALTPLPEDLSGGNSNG